MMAYLGGLGGLLPYQQVSQQGMVESRRCSRTIPLDDKTMPRGQHRGAGSVIDKLASATAGGSAGYCQHVPSKVHLGVTEAADAGGIRPSQHGNIQHCTTSQHIPAEKSGNTSP